jgi:hypothetical protein
MENLKTISVSEIKQLHNDGKISFIGSNFHNVNSQGNYGINENGIYKKQNSSHKVVFHKIAAFN